MSARITMSARVTMSGRVTMPSCAFVIWGPRSLIGPLACVMLDRRGRKAYCGLVSRFTDAATTGSNRGFQP
jgi:hypothetical protein